VFNRRTRTLTFFGGTAAGGAVFALLVLLGAFATGGTAATRAVPSNTAPPTVTGQALEGQTLTAKNGTWTGTEPIKFAYRWLRCDNDGGSCGSISGATDQTYTLKRVDVDNTLRVRVTATNSSGSSSATSVPTAVVKAATQPAPPTGCGKPADGKLMVSDVSPPARLLIDQQQVSPSTITFGTRAITMRFHVTACGGVPVQGALVYATAVPYGQLAIPNEQTTAADGWATLEFQALSGFPVSQKQQLLVMFVRARKPGENLLAGISTRRLVSFRVAH
jgi:hypothetical protein